MDWKQILQMDWGQYARLWFTRAAQFWLIQTVLAYLCACAIAKKPIGPTDYVRFSYHVIQWHPGQSGEPAATAYSNPR